MAWSISNAMMKAYENSHCSQEQAAESSEGTCSDGIASAQSNITPMPDQYYWPDKTTEHSRLSRFGMTCEPLMASRGEDLLMWFRAGFLARTSAQLEKVTAWTGKEADCGRKWLGLLAKFDPDLLLWKTPQSSLVEGLDVYSETWPSWGSMQNGESWERITPELRTCATEFGLWPTPCATDSSDRKVDTGALHATKKGTFKHRGKNGVLSQIRLSQVVKHRTPGGVGRMTAEWCEWLMGWPIGQTELKPLATDRFQEWLKQHGKY